MPISIEELPKNLNYAQVQAKWTRIWEERGYSRAEPDDRETYTIVIPPPNVTGALHLGHALNNTLQDVMIRFHRMRGLNTLWMPGTDHAGIATQAVVERRLKEEEGLTRHDLGREGLLERIWKWKGQYEARILEQLKGMGCSCDWQRNRFTLDDTCAKAVRQTFFDLFAKGLIYRGKRLVNWDTYLQTAVSDDEVFHEEVRGHFWHFRYPVIDPKEGEPAHVTIATTRPETMLGDTAVAVHPDPAAALDKVEAALLEKLKSGPAKEKEATEQQLCVLRERREKKLANLELLRDMARDGRQVMLPLQDRPIPLICDEWAKPELGSGCVKITPAHDPNDYEVWQRNQHIGAVNILNPDGTLNKNAGKYEGQTIKEARKRVVADLAGLDLHDPESDVEDRLIDLAHSDRSKTPIEPYLADQWFVKMDELAQTAMDAVTDGRVKIVPQRYAKSYLDWLSEKRDWPVGRQLWWGHRIPVWKRPIAEVDFKGKTRDSANWANAQLKIDPALGFGDIEEYASHQFFGDADENTWWSCVCVMPGHADFETFLEEQGYSQDDDVLDTWFSSALWPHSTLGWPGPPVNDDAPDWERMKAYYPTSTLITSRDIITLWVARMVLMGLNNVGEVPFREVFIHPKILDGYGETMSKSKGNGVDPLDVIDKFGADSLRFGLAYMTTETQDVRMPVQFECPHCGSLIDQTKKNRQLARVTCPSCEKEFSTQWAQSGSEDAKLPRGPVVAERFEQARNFCNKLWNASRFALSNLEGYTPGSVADDELAVEDRWLLSRLATVTQQVTAGVEQYRYAEFCRTLYDFAWDEFCSFYIEMVKSRLQDDAQRPVAQRVLAFALDQLLRLLHPVIPFITEEIWELLGQMAPQRGLSDPQPAAEGVMIADWPASDAARIDPEIEARFATFQSVLGALREIRSRQNIPPKVSIEFAVRCTAAAAGQLQPMTPQFDSMARARSTGLGPDVTAPKTSATVAVGEMEVYVDLKDFIDPEAERARLEKLIEKLTKNIGGKEKKLANESFVQKAPAEVVERERESLTQLQQQLASARSSLAELE